MILAMAILQEEAPDGSTTTYEWMNSITCWPVTPCRAGWKLNTTPHTVS